MVNELTTYIKSMGQVSKKNDVLKNLNDTTSNINRSIIPVLDKSITFFKDNPIDVDKIKISKDLNTYGKLNVSSVTSLLIKLRDLFKEVNKNEGKLIRLVDDNFSGLISKTNLTVRETAILKTIEDISDMTLYTYDYIYLLINRHPDIQIDTEDNYLSKGKVNEIYKTLYTYAKMVDVYSDFTKYVNDLGKVADVNIKEDSNVSLLRSTINKLGKNVLVPNAKEFVGNIIYHWGIFWVDRDVNRYETLKDKQKTIELKILELQAKKNGSENPRLSKQIEYYEDKLKNTEYKMRDIENKI